MRTGSVCVVHPSRCESLDTWVSTVNPGWSNALPRTTCAVLRPTPGRVVSADMGCDERRGELVGNEQGRRHLVDPLVGALRAEDRGHQQFVRVAEIEFAVRVGIDLLQDPVHGSGSAYQRDRGTLFHRPRVRARGVEIPATVGHRPVRRHPVGGHPLGATTRSSGQADR